MSHVTLGERQYWPALALRRLSVKWLKRTAVVAGVVRLLWGIAWVTAPPLCK
jgi:hypothetical protein